MMRRLVGAALEGVRVFRTELHKIHPPRDPAATELPCAACGEPATTTRAIRFGHRTIDVDACGPCSRRSAHLTASLVEDGLHDGRITLPEDQF